MSLTTIGSKELLRIQKLVERKETLAQQIAEINSELETFEAGTSPRAHSAEPAAASKTRAKPAPQQKQKSGGRARPGGLKDRIVKELKSAGPQGVKVMDLAAKLGTSYGNVTAFFKGTGKRMKEVSKVGPAQFAWKP
jgi:hypothetical protein